MPSATFQETAQIGRAPSAVWDFLQEPSIRASVGPVHKVWDPEVNDGFLTGLKWSTDIGSKVHEGVGTALEHDRPRRYALDPDAGEMAGTISTNLSDGNPGGTGIVGSIEIHSKGMLS